jgi:hypothetical protein
MGKRDLVEVGAPRLDLAQDHVRVATCGYDGSAKSVLAD